MSMTSYERALLIVNPVSGQGRGLRLGQQLRESLESHGVVCSVRVTSGQGTPGAGPMPRVTGMPVRST